MPKNWSVYEPESVYQYLEKNDDKIEVGDFINYETNNQMGMVRYVVILGEDGKKSLKQIADYYSMMEEMDNGDEEEEQKAGKRRRRKTMRKTRRHKKSKHGKKSRQHKTKKNRKYRKH
jgi:hypothetical protein